MRPARAQYHYGPGQIEIGQGTLAANFQRQGFFFDIVAYKADLGRALAQGRGGKKDLQWSRLARLQGERRGFGTGFSGLRMGLYLQARIAGIGGDQSLVGAFSQSHVVEFQRTRWM